MKIVQAPIDEDMLRLANRRAKAQHSSRPAAKTREIETVFDFLAKGQCRAPQDWKWRFKENSEKMRSGSLHQVAEVLKSLLILNQAESLSFREKKMLDRAWSFLVGEIAVARGLQKQTAEDLLVKNLSKSKLIRMACRQYIRRLEEDEMDRRYIDGYRRKPENPALGEAGAKLAAHIWPKEDWDEAR